MKIFKDLLFYSEWQDFTRMAKKDSTCCFTVGIQAFFLSGSSAVLIPSLVFNRLIPYCITHIPRVTCEKIHFFLEQQKIKEQSFHKSCGEYKGNFTFTSVDDFVRNFNFEFTYVSFQTFILQLYTMYCARNKHIL